MKLNIIILICLLGITSLQSKKNNLTINTKKIKTVPIIKRAWQAYPAPGICFEVEGVEIRANYELIKKECY